MTLLIIILALGLDQLIGEIKKWHPLVGFGLLANKVEKYFQRKRRSSALSCNITKQRLIGAFAVALITIPFVFIGYALSSVPLFFILFDILVLYFALGAKSLKQHALNIYQPLKRNDINAAKAKTQLIVSRDTKTMTENDISKAAIESVLENGNDATFAVIFWFLIAGAPGVILFRLVNTLDAMWGYRTERFLHFGWAAAKLDDAMNYIPARLTALTYAIVSQLKTRKIKAENFKNALLCWKTQSSSWDSPNAGPVMAAGAGALSVKLGGTAVYHGQIIHRPTLGMNNAAKADDIIKAVKLVDHSILLWVIVIAIAIATIGTY